MPRIPPPSSPSTSDFSSRSASPDPGNASTDGRPATPTAEPPPLPEKPQFLKDIQSRLAASSTPDLTQRAREIAKIAKTNVRMAEANLATMQHTFEFARHFGGVTPRHANSLASAQSRHENAHAAFDKIIEREAEGQTQTSSTSAWHENTLRFADEQLDVLAAQRRRGAQTDRVRVSDHDRRTDSAPHATIGTPGADESGQGLWRPVRPFHVQDVVLNYIGEFMRAGSAQNKSSLEISDDLVELGVRLGIEQSALDRFRQDYFWSNPPNQRKAALDGMEAQLDDAAKRKLDSRHYGTVRTAIDELIKQVHRTAHHTEDPEGTAPMNKPRL
ncbi:hypothetical protein [Burkholderia stabilis]|uniref:hypothetical protein n=1 Tax=Burkholderia stabilis TaxID=95485 RepID=UPI00158B5982|nr:hypothetical protein [Burkholderia stabilis]